MTHTDKITHLVINAQVLNNRLSDALIQGIFKQSLKNKAKLFLDELLKVEAEYYDKFFNDIEDSTIQVYDVYEKFFNTISNVPIYEMENISTMLEAYKKDKKSIEGICRKILRN